MAKRRSRGLAERVPSIPLTLTARRYQKHNKTGQSVAAALQPQGPRARVPVQFDARTRAYRDFHLALLYAS
jgi:hypothetical protein